MLDVKIWITKNRDGIAKIVHEHYVKDVSSRSLIHYTSAHSTNVKINVMTNEAKRIIRNCSTELEWKDTARHLSYFVKRMQFSGYPKEIRYRVMKKAIDVHKHNTNERNIENRQRFTPSLENRKTRLKSKEEKKRKWCEREGKYENVMFVEATKNSELKSKIEMAAKRNKLKIKIQERSGTKVKQLLQRSDPFSTKKCSREECMIILIL